MIFVGRPFWSVVLPVLGLGMLLPGSLDRVVVIANLRWGLSAEPRNLALSGAPPGGARQ
jgi:hypothetical protein